MDISDIDSEFERDNEGNYIYSFAAENWTAWNAALDSVDIEIPSVLGVKPYACYEGGWNDALCECIDAIEAQGMKVKP